MYVLHKVTFSLRFISHIIGGKGAFIIKKRNKDWSQISFETYIIQDPVCQSAIWLYQLYLSRFGHLSEPLFLSLQTWTPQWKDIRLRLTFAATSMGAIFARAKMLVLYNTQSNLSLFSSLLFSPLPFLLSPSVTEEEKTPTKPPTPLNGKG